MDREIQAPIDKKTAKELRAGDYVKITGTIYTARDAAHKRMAEALDKGEKLPVDIHGETILLYGADTGAGRQGDWLCRSDYGQPHGQIRSASFGYGDGGNDRKRKTDKRSGGCSCAK